MKLLLVIFLCFLLTTSCHGFFATLFDYGPQSLNCDKWSLLWSQCFSPEQKSMFMRIPANCQNYNPFVSNFVQNGGMHTMDLAYKWLRKVVKNGANCGMCSFQITCSRKCDILTGPEQQALVGQGLFPAQSAFNQYGVSQRLCAGLEQSSACIADPNEAWNPATGTCQMWPPIRDQAMPDTVGPTKLIVQYNVPPTPCIFLQGQCYCCCYPYIPDAKTLKCIRVA